MGSISKFEEEIKENIRRLGKSDEVPALFEQPEGQLLTVLIPTHNRPNYFRRSATFFRANASEANLLIADSSDDSIYELNRQTIQKVAIDGLKHLDCRGMKVQDKLVYAISNITTPFVVVCGDDDFLNYQWVVRCAEFLSDNEDYSHAHGRILSFGVSNSGEAMNVEEYAQISNEGELEERLILHFRQYCNNYYSVHRTGLFLSIIQKVLSVEMGRGLQERALAALDVCYGKRKMFDQIFLLRQKGHTGVDENGGRTLPDDPRDLNYFDVIGHGYQAYEQLIGDVLETDQGVDANGKKLILQEVLLDFERWKAKKLAKKVRLNFMQRCVHFLRRHIGRYRLKLQLLSSLSNEDRRFLEQASIAIREHHKVKS